MKFLASILVLATSASALAVPRGMPVVVVKSEQNTRAATPQAASTGGSGAPSSTAKNAASQGPPNTVSNVTGGPGAATSETGINPSLVPDFGVMPNTNADARQKGSCDGFNAASNAVVNIPCACPPPRADFLAALARNVAAGSALQAGGGGEQAPRVQFSNDAADQSPAAVRQRATAMLVTLQNLRGAGVGCPAASAPNFAVMQKTGVVSSKVFVQ